MADYALLINATSDTVQWVDAITAYNDSTYTSGTTWHVLTIVSGNLAWDDSPPAVGSRALEIEPTADNLHWQFVS